MLVFRELRQALSSARLLEDLFADLRQLQLSSPTARQSLIESALLRAGELECGLADVIGDASSVEGLSSSHISTRITDLLAKALLVPAAANQLAAQAQQLCRQLRCPPTIEATPPEGFCFYALHPLDYADLALQIPLQDGPVAVIGIRTIGTTLSAVVAAALQRAIPEQEIDRITVRPTGHPYDRKTILVGEALAFVRRNCQKNSAFLIVDEGPGLSGSSFLSVAESLVAEGVAADQIRLICSHEANPETLVTPNAATRWRKFRSFAVYSAKRLPVPAHELLPAGDWRPRIFSQPDYASSPYRNPEQWPAIWMGMNPPIFFPADSSASPAILKYEGLGEFGAVVRKRSCVVADAGFGPMPTAAGLGYTAYPLLRGKLLSQADVAESLLSRLAAYLAFRAAEFQTEISNQSALVQMTRFNFRQITGTELEASFHLELCRPVIADARMMPHEWIQLHIHISDGGVQKLDSAAHGDNHFFPGPTDIAWDLAGVIVEWELDAPTADYFVGCYERLSGDTSRQRLPDYLVAYAAFQAGYAKMAHAAVSGENEKFRLQRDYERYRKVLTKFAVARRQACAV